MSGKVIVIILLAAALIPLSWTTSGEQVTAGSNEPTVLSRAIDMLVHTGHERPTPTPIPANEPVSAPSYYLEKYPGVQYFVTPTPAPLYLPNDQRLVQPYRSPVLTPIPQVAVKPVGPGAGQFLKSR